MGLDSAKMNAVSAAGPTPPATAPLPTSRDRVGISWSETAIRSSAPPVRIVGVSRRYQGGFRVNV